jgi:hypothetical protein
MPPPALCENGGTFAEADRMHTSSVDRIHTNRETTFEKSTPRTSPMHANSSVTFPRHASASSIASAEDARKGGMGNAEHRVHLVALAHYTRVLPALAKNALEIVADSNNASPAGTNYTISPGRVFTLNGRYIYISRILRASHFRLLL